MVRVKADLLDCQHHPQLPALLSYNQTTHEWDLREAAQTAHSNRMNSSQSTTLEKVSSGKLCYSGREAHRYVAVVDHTVAEMDMQRGDLPY